MIRSGCREPLAFVIADVVEHVAHPRRVSLIRDVWGYRIITTTESANDCKFFGHSNLKGTAFAGGSQLVRLAATLWASM
jgi:hypothetical protein